MDGEHIMALWIDSNNQVHDDMDSAALALPSWPKGMSPYTPPPITPPTEAEIFTQTEATYNQAVQAYIVSIAQKKGYRDDVSCASYFNDPHQPFASDAQAFVPWRSSVWQQCYIDLAAIQAGTMVMPTSPEAYILTLPIVPSGF
jgi:hypothetical protein